MSAGEATGGRKGAASEPTFSLDTAYFVAGGVEGDAFVHYYLLPAARVVHVHVYPSVRPAAEESS